MERPVILLIKEIYYPVLATIGFPANMMTIVVLVRGNCGLSKCISVYMLAMATADLLVIINNVIVYSILMYHFPLSFLSHTHICKFIFYMGCVILNISVWFTVAFTFDRFAIICCPKFKTKYCTVRIPVTIITVIFVFMWIKDFPIFFAYEHEHIIKNVEWNCQSSVTFFSSIAGLAYIWFYSICLVWLPFILIGLFNALTIRHILVTSKARRGLRAHTFDNHYDPEMKNRMKSIVLLFAISGSFIMLWLTTVVNLVTTKVTNPNYYRGDLGNPTYIIVETGAMLRYLSSCSNTCIYAVIQRKFREEFLGILKLTCAFIVKNLKVKRDD
ncbi:probable G-protein coupled receptor 139 [Stegostoma tigrinum]|uniref:probable G-protein coupled receptor 139 n=1 Tax=Stegostoma tigrinum TaxID=3053191 RepID=UPI00202AEA01|nr:probable G-protein coupled receptor 139 [Stegostoma tigrinum]